MTLRLTLGFDPGLTGALVVLADGEPRDITHLPVHSVPDPTKANPDRRKQELNPFRLSAIVRGILRNHPGADVCAVLEHIAMRPDNSRSSDQRVGENFGAIKGVLGSLGVPWTMVRPQCWKRHFDLIGTEKDVARQYVLARWPEFGVAFLQKRDIGRADALLIARWGWETEAHAGPHLVPRSA